MAENKELGLDSLKNVNWLDDNAPAPPAVEEATAQEEAINEPESTEPSEEKPEVQEESTQVDIASVPQDVSNEDEPSSENEPESVDSTSSEEPELGVIDTLSQRFGYEIAGDFADDYDGLEKYTTAVAGKIAEERVSGLFEQYPDVREYLEYRANNGDPRKYFQAQQADMNYQSLKLENNAALQKRIVYDGMKMQGFDDAAISKMADAYEDAGILQDNAEVYLTHLQKAQANRKQELIASQEKQAATERENATQYWNAVANTVETGELKGLKIPTKQRKQFYNWMTSPVNKQGNTQRDIDRSKLDTESALALEYLIYQGFDLTKLSQNVSNTKKTQSLKNKLQSAPSASTRMKSRSKSTVSKAAPLPSLRDLL